MIYSPLDIEWWLKKNVSIHKAVHSFWQFFEIIKNQIEQVSDQKFA